MGLARKVKSVLILTFWFHPSSLKSTDQQQWRSVIKEWTGTEDMPLTPYGDRAPSVSSATLISHQAAMKLRLKLNRFRMYHVCVYSAKHSGLMLCLTRNSLNYILSRERERETPYITQILVFPLSLYYTNCWKHVYKNVTSCRHIKTHRHTWRHTVSERETDTHTHTHTNRERDRDTCHTVRERQTHDVTLVQRQRHRERDTQRDRHITSHCVRERQTHMTSHCQRDRDRHMTSPWVSARDTHDVTLGQRQRDRERERQTDRQTDTHTHTWRHTVRDRQTHDVTLVLLTNLVFLSPSSFPSVLSCEEKPFFFCCLPSRPAE